MVEEILEIGYNKYKPVAEVYYSLTELMFELAEFNLFEMQKKFPDKLKESREQIEQLKADIKKGDELPPIIVQVDDMDKFVTIVDGFHRTLAYKELGIVRCFATLVERI